MSQLERKDLEQSALILDEEDEVTLAAIDRGVRSADEGRVVALEEARNRMNQWRTKSSSRKTR
jgi:predicted transcriptional regulator